MSDRQSAFPLRLRDPKLRTLVREVAQREGISQNELIEQAIEDDLVVRGRLLADELQATVDRLTSLSDDTYAALVERGDRGFAEGEGRPEPLKAQALHAPRPGSRRRSALPSAALDHLGVLAAFNAGHR